MLTYLEGAAKSSGGIGAKTVLNLTRVGAGLLVLGAVVAGCDSSESPPQSTANAGASGTGDVSSGTSGSAGEAGSTSSQGGSSTGGSAHAGETSAQAGEAGNLEGGGDSLGGGEDAGAPSIGNHPVFELEWLMERADQAVPLRDGNIGLFGTKTDETNAETPTALVVAEVNLQGEVLWYESILDNHCLPDSESCAVASQVRPSSSGIFIAGSTPVPFPGEIQSADTDQFLAYLDLSGHLLWVNQVDFVAGTLSNVDGEGHVAVLTAERASTTPAVVTQYGSDGTKNWSAELDNSLNTTFLGFDAAPDGTIYVFVGHFDLLQPEDDAIEVRRLSADGEAETTLAIDISGCAVSAQERYWHGALAADGTALYFVGYDCLLKVDTSGDLLYQITVPDDAVQNRGMIVSRDGSSVYLNQTPEAYAGDMNIARYSSDDGSMLWTTDIEFLRFDNLRVNDANDHLFYHDGIGPHCWVEGLNALSTSGDESPRRFLDLEVE